MSNLLWSVHMHWTKCPSLEGFKPRRYSILCVQELTIPVSIPLFIPGLAETQRSYTSLVQWSHGNTATFARWTRWSSPPARTPRRMSPRTSSGGGGRSTAVQSKYVVAIVTPGRERGVVTAVAWKSSHLQKCPSLAVAQFPGEYFYEHPPVSCKSCV